MAVWVGNAAGEAMHDVSGVSGAAPVWREVMDWLQRDRKMPAGVATPPPAGVQLSLIHIWLNVFSMRCVLKTVWRVRPSKNAWCAGLRAPCAEKVIA